MAENVARVTRTENLGVFPKWMDAGTSTRALVGFSMYFMALDGSTRKEEIREEERVGRDSGREKRKRKYGRTHATRGDGEKDQEAKGKLMLEENVSRCIGPMSDAVM